jgi:hypothetical protein
MGDPGKPCEERRKTTPREIFWKVFPSAVSIIMFLILYIFIIPKTTATEKLNQHEGRIMVLEKDAERLDRIESDVSAIRNYLMGAKK